MDIAAWGWIDKATVVLGEQGLAPYPNIARWFDSINNRPAVHRARQVDQHIEFKKEADDQALRALYPSNYPKA